MSQGKAKQQILSLAKKAWGNECYPPSTEYSVGEPMSAHLQQDLDSGWQIYLLQPYSMPFKPRDSSPVVLIFYSEASESCGG